ncbi:MAG: adenosylcobinamide-GDP ribazoletransferase [Methanosarcinales archaeon]|nr:adenosylcobinamide-GDP ribazoletransferase [Methanosarcinales archaeon]
MNGFLLALKTSFGFLSTIPVGITMEGLDELVKRSYLQTFAGVVLGLMIGAFAFITEVALPDQISAVLIMVFIYYLTGLNHLDGLGDFGDGATAHGSLEKKIKALKDVSLGIGGVGYAALALIALYASISALQAEVMFFSDNAAFVLAVSMLIAEIGAKQAMLTVAAFGKPIHEGLGSMIVNSTTFPRYVVSFIFGAIASILAFGSIGVIGYLAAIITAFVIINISNRHFKGVNGDCIGTANEIARIIVLIVITITITSINNGYGGLLWTLL